MAPGGRRDEPGRWAALVQAARARRQRARDRRLGARGARAERRRRAIYSAQCGARQFSERRLGMRRGGCRGAAGCASASARRRSPRRRRLRRAGRAVRRDAPLAQARRRRLRLQMWAYLAAYKSPHDDPDAQERRTHFDYPIVADRVLGLGELPSVRLQRALARVGPDRPGMAHARPRARVGALGLVPGPHGTVAYVLLRHPERFPRAAAMTYAVFDVGASFYWLVPTAPPWYRRPQRRARRPTSQVVRRMMVEYGEHFWRDGWGPLYSVFGGNPLAAMPSLHFATSLMAALLLAEVGPVAGAFGFAYAAHARLRAGVPRRALRRRSARRRRADGGVRRLAPARRAAGRRIAGRVGALEAIAHEGGRGGA